MLLAHSGWGDCECGEPFSLGRTSPYALFYAKGYDFQSVTASASVSGADTSFMWITGAGPLEAITVGPGSSATITKEFMESNGLGTGVYAIGCWAEGGCGESAGWIYYAGPGVLGDFTPVSSSLSGKTVHYTYTSPDGYYDARSYVLFAPNGGTAGGGSLANSGSIDINFSQRGPYGFACEGTGNLSWDCFNADLHHVDGRVETPTFSINHITSSTSSSTQYASAIEPAYGDNVTFHWQKTYNEFHADSIVILQEDAAGTIIDPDDPNKKYSIIETVPLESSTNVVDHGISNYWQWTGDLTWPTSGTNLPEFPSGHHRLGIKYDDGYVWLTGQYIDVYLSIYDVYTENHAPFYVGIDTEDKTSIYYKMSAEAQAGEVNINLGGAKTIPGTPNKGQNALPNAWDGSTSPDNYVRGGSYGLTFGVTPLSGSVGPLLSVYVSSDSSFTPALNETLTVDVNIQEPVRRPQATQAELTAIIYDSNGEFVRLLANEQQANINNQVDLTDGHNALVWDGKNEKGETVDPGDYTITLFAKDNAGVGCESDCVIRTVTVAEPPQTEADLEWPVDGITSEDDEDSGSITGYTDSGDYSVEYGFDGGGLTQTASVDPSTGMFSIDVSALAGLHTVTIRTTSWQYGDKEITVQFFRNTFSITSPQNAARFDPQANGNISVQYTSQAVDTVDVYVVDPYDQAGCISPQQPVPSAEVMNGTVSEKTVKAIATGLSVVAGSNTVIWDGKDSSGNFVSPGVYNVVIQRSNTDELLDTSTAVQVVVEHPNGAPQISGVTTSVQGACIAISWSTDIATTGYVICEPSDDAQSLFRFSAGSASTNHTVWLPGTTPGTTYNYYVVATNPTTSASAVSDLRTVTAGNGPAIGNVSTTSSGNQLQISYSSESPVTAAVEYARVGPGINPIQWQRVEHAYKDQDHVFMLTNLQSNSEYVYRIIGATDNTWAESTKTEFRWFTTKTDPCSVSFTNLEDRAGVTELSDITVSASDAAHRFSDHGITKVELYVDGESVESYDKTATGDHVDYTFHVGSMNLTNGLHQIEAIAYDDYWQETDKRIQVLLDSGSSGMQSMSVSGGIHTLDSGTESTPGLDKERRKAQAVSAIAKLGYRAGPRYRGKKLRGSIGYLYLGVRTKDGMIHFHWRATSGIGWNYRVPNNTLPPGTWHTAPHPRAGGYVEGVPSGDFGAYLIHPSGATVKPWPPRRIREAFHIHGNWGPPYGWHNGEKYYHNSHGCIILHRGDLLDLKAKWQRYVLHGAEHGSSSIGVPLKVEYYNKQVAP